MRNLLLLCFAVFSFGTIQAQDCTGADHTVLTGSFYYTPNTLTITAGESVAFSNEGGFHNVNGESSSLGLTWSNPETFSLGANSGAEGGVCMGSITLNTPGTYNYDCSIGSHAAAGMVGTIIVEAAASSTPTDNATDPTLDAGDVVSVYGGSYDNIANNYNPFWNQSGTVNTDFDPGTGNLVLEYANFNYQGTDLAAADLSGMTHLHVDVWVASDNDRMLKVSPINGGTGTGEYLVEVPLTPGSWNSVDMSKADFDGMTWDNVFQMKFDGGFNADGSGNGDGWDVYLDNIYFWNDGTGSGPPSGETVDVTFNVNMVNENVSSDGVHVAGGSFFGGPGDNPMTDTGNDIWTTTIAVPVGFTGNYTFTNGGSACGWNCKENIEGQDCADGQYNDRLLSNITEATTINTCFGECTTDGSCPAPTTQYDVTFQVDMSNQDLNGDETIYVTGSIDGWCGPCDNVLTDDNGDGVYAGVVSLDPGSYEFKYMINAWGGDEQSITGTDCDFVPGDANGNRGFTLTDADLVLDAQCFDFCGTCDEQNNQGTVDITWNVNMSNEEVSADGVFLAGGGFFGNPGDNPLTDNGNGIWSITMTLAEGFSSHYIFTNGACGDWGCKEDLGGQDCGDPDNYNDRYLDNIAETTTFNFCFGECGTDGTCVGDDGGGDDDVVGPTDNAPDPTQDASDVVSVYSGAYDNIATNYNPGWGQSGSVNTDYDPGTGNNVLHYSNFNYQGTELSSTNLSGMTHLHLDVWVASDNDRMLKVTPINGGEGAGEVLVEVPLTPGAWNSVDLTKAAFDGMTWDNVFQMKFDGQFSADGSENGAGWDVFIDNLYFWNDGTGSGPPSGETVDVTFMVNMSNETVSDEGVSVAGGNYFGFPGDNPMTDSGNGIWTVTIAVPVGFTGNYTFTNGGSNCGWDCKENIAGQDCADGEYNDRLLSNITEATTINTCFGVCSTDGSCDNGGVDDGTGPTDNATDPAQDASNVISVYGGSYDNIATNYNPGWGQSGSVNTDYDPGTGNLVMAYTNFNYQGTDLNAADASGMEFLHIDIWVASDYDRMVKVSPINGGTGAGEFLVEVPVTPGSWNSVDLPKSAFDGMTWDNVFQMKFDGQFNGDGSENGDPQDIYLDNIYFYSGAPVGGGDVAVTFSVDMSNYTGLFDTLNVSGTWNDFCGTCNVMSDEDEDGIWTATIELPAGDNYRYKFQVDAWSDQEDLSPGDNPIGPCVVKEGGFTNRDLDVAGSDPILLDTVCWGSCLACVAQDAILGCNDASASNYDEAATANDGSCMYDVTFSVNMSEYALSPEDSVYVNGEFNDWCGSCNPLSDDDEDGVWSATISLTYDYYEYKFTVNEWDAQEDLAGLTGCVTENFGYTNRVLQLFGNQSQPVVCWNSCSNCEGGGDIAGCTDAAAINYAATANVDDGSCQYNVTFQVDMSNEALADGDIVYVNGGFNGWCGECNPMTNDGLDNVWSLTIPLAAGDHEYKFTINGWSTQEEFPIGAPCDFNPSDEYGNRGFTLVSDLVLDLVCYNSCYSCDVNTGCTDAGAQNYDADADVDDGSCAYLVTFRLDMNQQDDTDGAYIVGAFQGWTNGSTQMSTPGLGLYEYTVQLSNGSHEYKFLNGPEWSGEESVPSECGIDNGQGGWNRGVMVNGANMTLDIVCFGNCGACAGCTDPLSAEFSPWAGEDDGSCATALVFGCTYNDADNFNPGANQEDGSCVFTGGSSCPTDIDGDGSTAVGDLLIILGQFGQTCVD